ncbi:hypothetical protein [Dactylosporangium sp. CA-139066]|uniref:hypothetical protein n=1 Tax=Dactylosporangium sp. CA-139066 TaxID=3239930 RepID=UPI003D8B6E8E
MSDVHTGGGLLHRLTHKIPGVPPHTGQPRGHQGRSPRLRDHPPRRQATSPHLTGRSPSLNHSAGRRPRVLVGWQRRIAALFGHDLP